MEINKFRDINLSQSILKGIEKMGFEEMTPIQKTTIPVILEGKDIIGQAQTGTGKTAAFGIPIIEMVDTKEKSVQVLILCPTRELSIQVANEIDNLGKYVKGLNVLPIYGGQSISKQINDLKRGVQIVVGTPGRVIDHIKRKTLKLNNVSKIILDEADEMFDMGFRDDISLVMNELGKNVQTIFFSATMPKEIINFAKRYQDNPEIVKVAHQELTMPRIKQYYIELNERAKTETLCRLVDVENPRLSVIFTNTKRKADELVGDLQKRGYKADALHGDLSQNQRDKVMDKFRKNTIRILVATDVAARGIDVDEVDMVFNYDIPRDEEYYVHRIGRTARAGREGISYSFVTNKDRRQLRNIERYAKTTIERGKIPTVEDLSELNEDTIKENITKTIESKKHTQTQEILKDLIQKGYSEEDVAMAGLKIYLDSLTKGVNMNLEKNILNVDTRDSRDNRDDSRRNRKPRREDQRGSQKSNLSKNDSTRIYINVGRTKGIGPANVLAAIIEETGVSKDQVGSIDIFDKFTFVDIGKDVDDMVIENLNNKKINRNTVTVEKANRK